MRKAIFCLLAAALLVCGQRVQATIFSSVHGIVHDPQHRPITGAEVDLKAAASDWSSATQSDADGAFEFNPVSVGDYIVTVSHAGFDTLQQTITVVSDTSPIYHFQLKIATLNQAVTVTAQPEVANVDSVTPTTLVDRQDIAETPGADRTNSLAMITDYVPAAYVTHDMLHMRGGHQVDWLIDGVPVPNTNIAANLAPVIDPKDVDYLEVLEAATTPTMATAPTESSTSCPETASSGTMTRN